MVARYRKSFRPINSLKHVVDSSATIAAGVQLDTVIMDAVQTPVLTTPVQTAIGATVGSIYLDVECASNEVFDSGAIPNVYMIVFKNPGNNLTVPSASSVGTSDVKRFVIHQEMLMINNFVGGNPRTLFKGVIKIPRGMARQGNDDALIVAVVSPQINLALCIQAIYKEFR